MRPSTRHQGARSVLAFHSGTQWALPRRVSGWTLLVLLGLACLIACGQPPPRNAQPVVWQVVVADGQTFPLEERPTEAEPAIDEAMARARATRYVPMATRATTVTARFVALTVSTEQMTWNIQARPTWLVTYVDVPFVNEGCACHGSTETVHTVVALDGQSGDLVLLYGVGDEAGS